MKDHTQDGEGRVAACHNYAHIKICAKIFPDAQNVIFKKSSEQAQKDKKWHNITRGDILGPN